MPASPEKLIREAVERGNVLGVCPHDCPDSCSVLAQVEGGRVLRVDGNPDHPVTRGTICRKYREFPSRLYDGARLCSPLKRRGAKGSGDFEEISWEQALAVIGDRWRKIIADDGAHAILPFMGSGTEGLVHGHLAPKRFFNRLGTLQLVRTICTKAGREGYRITMGTSLGADPTRIAEAELVVDWGVNTAATNMHQQTYLKAARRNGAKYAVVNPLAVTGAERAEFFLRPRPGTDGALALSMMRVIAEEDLHDGEFMSRHTLGGDEFMERLRDYPPERGEAITGVAADDIRSFARAYAESAPSFIYVGPGCQRHSNGGMTLRTLACLPALTGAWRHPAGGLYFPTSTCFPADFESLEGGELRPNPAAGYNMIHLGRMLEGEGIKSLYVLNGNPASVLYDQNRLRKGLVRDDLFTVVHERFLTDTARFADIVLPATTQFEQNDIHFSYYHPSLLLNRQAVRPPVGCRSNLDTFRALAVEMGFADDCFGDDEEAVIGQVLGLEAPAVRGVDREMLDREGWSPAGVDPAQAAFVRHRYPTPSGRIELRSEREAALGRDPLPGYVPPKESRDGSPDLFQQYPLQFITPSAHSIHNSNYGEREGFREDEREPRLLIHPGDARRRGIGEGQPVRVHNRRGECRLLAQVTEDVRPGVVAARGQWWDWRYVDGANANFTTPDFPADLGGGSAFNSNLVEVTAIPPEELP